MDDPRGNDVFDRELRRALAAGGGAAAGPHVEAELAAAWIDRRLDAPAARAVEAHLADCTDCQAMMATLARMTPEVPVAGVAWWRRLRAGWLVPAAVAAAAGLVIWVALPQQRSTPTALDTLQSRDQSRDERTPSTAQRELSLEKAAEPPAAPAPPPASARVAPLARTATTTETEADAKREQAPPLADAAPSPPPPPSLQPAPAPSPAVAPPSPAAPALERRERLADSSRRSTESLGAKAENPDAKAERADNKVTVAGETPAQQDANAERPRALNETVTVGRAQGGALASTLRQAPVGQTVAADGAARWRQAGARLEFAPRADASFVAASLPVSADTLTAASAPGGTVCWMAGRAGIVIVSTDGVRFTRTSVPAPLNLVAIVATGARTATVTAADGRRFRTTDAGATWTALP